MISKNKLLVAGAIIFVLLFLLGILYINSQDSEESDSISFNNPNGIEMEDSQKDSGKIDMTTDKEDELNNSTYEYSGTLEDVTDGETILGINTGGNSSGSAQFEYSDGEFNLKAIFANLPDPTGEDFYEGWLVDRSSGDFISTGVVNKNNGQYANYYTSTTDYTEFSYYVLTLEPNDGDPDPAAHIVEGQLNKSAQENSQSNTQTNQPGQYIEFAGFPFDDTKTNVLFFKASWCPTCKVLDQDINDSLSSIPTDVVIHKVDYDEVSGATREEIDLKDDYKVTYQHTLVQVDKDGNQIKKWQNSLDLEELVSEII